MKWATRKGERKKKSGWARERGIGADHHRDYPYMIMLMGPCWALIFKFLGPSKNFQGSPL